MQLSTANIIIICFLSFTNGDKYNVESGVEMRVVAGDVAGNARGWRLFAEVNVHRVWANTTNSEDHLLHFQILSGRIESSGKGASYRMKYKLKSNFAVRIKNGILDELYLEQDVELALANLARAIASAFQFDGRLKGGGQSTETDINGLCNVTYEPLPDTSIRKVKRNCSWHGEDETDAVVRVSRVFLSQSGSLVNVSSDDAIGWSLSDDSPRLKARSWLRISRLSEEWKVVEQWPTHIPSSLVPATIEAQDGPAQDNVKLNEAFQDARNWLELLNDDSAMPFSTEGLFALQRLVDAMLRSKEKDIDAIVRQHETLMKGLAMCLAACGSDSCHRVASRALRLRSDEPFQPHAHTYVMSLQHEHVSEGAREQLSRLGAWSVGATPPQSWLSSALALCGDDESCVERVLRSSIAWKCSSCAHEYVAVALNGSGAEVRLRAISALAHLPHDAVRHHLRDIERVALGLTRAHAQVEVRALALSLLLSTATRSARQLSLSLLPIPLCEIIRALETFAPFDLLVLTRSILTSLRAESAAVDSHLSLCGATLSRLALGKGLSGVLTRSLPLGSAALRFASLQAMRGQALRFGSVRLRIDSLPLIDISLHTTGMQHLVDSDAGDHNEMESEQYEDEPVSAHLSVSALGLSHWRVPLFDSQGALVSAALQGVGAEESLLVASLRPLQRRSVSLALSSGVVLSLSLSSSASASLSASASASLWSRTALCSLALRAQRVGEARLVARAFLAEAEASLAGASDATLLVSSHLDFYQKATMCVRARTAPAPSSWRWSVKGGSVVRGQWESSTAGATLALGSDSDALCSAMQHNTHYDD